MALQGMDVEEVKRVAKEVDREANELRRDIQRIGSKITSCTWKGPDRERFVADWNQQKMQANRTADMLQQTAKNMERNASEQEATSNR